jgi:hypothetical protein
VKKAAQGALRDEVQATLIGGIGVRLTNFAMADDPDYASGDFVRAKDLQVNLKFWPLLKKEARIKRVILHDPIIRVIRNSHGDFNFSSIGTKDKKKKEAGGKEKKPPAPKETSPPAFLVSLVDISGGDIHFIDRKEGTDLRLRQIDLKVEDLDFAQPFSVKVAAAVFADKQNFELTAKMGPPHSDGDYSRLPLDGEISFDPLDMTRLKAAAPKLLNALPRELDLSGVFRVKGLKFKGTLQDLAFNGEIGYGDGYSGDPYPFFKNFYLGGIGSVRGFEAASLGPRDIYGDPLGGTRRFSANFEALFPIPGADRTLRLSAFLDMGQVWGPGCNGIYSIPPNTDLNDVNNNPGAFCTGPYYGNTSGIDLSLIRYSAGVGIAWISPLGPLRLSYAYPLNPQPWDRIQRFQFQIGAGF